MQVNFILTRGDLQPGYVRALRSASVHGVPVVLWCTARTPPSVEGLGVELAHIDVPTWLKAQHQAHVFDVLAYQIAYEHGGLVLGLDTISLRPALDLLDRDVVVSTDWAPGDPNCGVTDDGVRHPYNNNFMARKGSDAAGMLMEESKRVIMRDAEVWGCTGPILLTRFVQAYPNLIAGAPYPALCGWSPGYVWRFFLGEQPGPDVRVIHLCRTAYLALWEGRYEDWAAANPGCAADVARRTGANDSLLTGG